MKLNATPRHYMPLPQNQSDDDESGPSKEEKLDKLSFKNVDSLSNGVRPTKQEDVDPKTLPMSPIRICIFILSLIICVLFIAIFVFFLPCISPINLKHNCHISYRWTRVLHNMSFIFPLSYADSRADNQLVLLAYVNDEQGLVAIQNSNGNTRWKLPLHSIPRQSICNVLDVNNDGVAECLIIGENGLLTAIDMEKGISLWYLHNHSNLNNAESVSGPLIMLDFDDDGISDIVISYNIANEKSTYLALVSGGTGQVIGSLVKLSECSRPISAKFLLKSKNETNLILYCLGKNSGNIWLLPSKALYDVAINETQELNLKNLYRVPHFVQDVQFFKVSSYKNRFVIVLDGIKCLLFKKTANNFKLLWKRHFITYTRVVADGIFMNGSFELVILNTNASQPQVAGLNIKDGKEMWSVIQQNGTIAFITKLPQFFGNVDGLVLKSLTYATTYNISDSKMKMKTLDGKMMLFKEKYIVVKCGKTPLIQNIDTEDVWSLCKGDLCQPDVQNENITALTYSKKAMSANILLLHSSLLSVNTTVTPAELIIKSLNVKSVVSLPKCSG